MLRHKRRPFSDKAYCNAPTVKQVGDAYTPTVFDQWEFVDCADCLKHRDDTYHAVSLRRSRKFR